jgi:hypothetical protein
MTRADGFTHPMTRAARRRLLQQVRRGLPAVRSEAQPA